VLVQRLTDGRYAGIAVNIDDAQTTVARLTWIAGLAGLSALVLLTVTGLWLIRASLAPLTAIERTAEGIAAGDLSRRLPQPGRRTEVGRLAHALNTMLGRIEEAYRARQVGEARARDSEERMRRFVADASHELRTPLTSIRGYADFYAQQGEAADRAEADRLVGRVRSEAARMGLLVDDLLLLARLDADRPLQLGPVDLTSEVAEAVHAVQASYPDRPITVAAPDEPVVISGDDHRLRQVVGNLLDNAAQHTPAGTQVQVLVEVTGAGPTGQAHLAVRDDGPGMTTEQTSHVFERFYRADAGRARATGGTGLGLAIVASLVAAHHGQVSVDSSPGRGSTFHVWLPVLTDSSRHPDESDPAHDGEQVTSAPDPLAAVEESWADWKSQRSITKS
jgi:two-component system OmpR family sensor kinase